MIILIFLEEAMVNICSIKYESKPRTAEVGSLTLYFSLFLTKKGSKILFFGTPYVAGGFSRGPCRGLLSQYCGHELISNFPVVLELCIVYISNQSTFYSILFN